MPMLCTNYCSVLLLCKEQTNLQNINDPNTTHANFDTDLAVVHIQCSKLQDSTMKHDEIMNSQFISPVKSCAQNPQNNIMLDSPISAIDINIQSLPSKVSPSYNNDSVIINCQDTRKQSNNTGHSTSTETNYTNQHASTETKKLIIVQTPITRGDIIINRYDNTNDKISKKKNHEDTRKLKMKYKKLCKETADNTNKQTKQILHDMHLIKVNKINDGKSVLPRILNPPT